MVATAQLDRVRQIAQDAGARVVLAGDPHQLAAVEAGGALSLLAEGRAETYSLTEVRRFTELWEAQASLRLRDGDLSALDEYDRRGRIVDAPTLDAAVQEAARRTAADLIEGRDAIAVAGSNDLAARIATAVRDQLVIAGQVPADGIHLPRDGSTAAVGDRVMTRQIDRALGVLNRERWTVAAVTEDGGLQVVNTDGEVHDLPAGYVTEHVQSAYAATGHAVQGVTVDRCVSVHDGRGDTASLYVPGTRARDRNTFVVALRPEPGEQAAGPAADADAAPSGRAVLSGLATTETDTLAARVQQERDAAWNQSMATIAGKLEDVTHLATLDRLDRDLDRLTAAGTLTAQDRLRLATDPSRAHLARVVRTAEQAGIDPFAALRDAAAQQELGTARSVAQVLATRIERTHGVAVEYSRQAPDRIPAHWQAHYDALQEAARERTRTLGTQAAQEPPPWATRTLGAVPEDPMARLEWEAQAGAIAAYRETVGWDDEHAAIGGPGMRTDTEKRALYLEAWEALGRPEVARDEAELTDGQLRLRCAAWEREQAWAPPHVDPALRHAELTADDARTEATLARAAGDTTRAEALDAQAQRHEAASRSMDTVADGRATWAAETAWTRAAAEAAREELTRRGQAPGREPDRTSAEEWLAAERAARAEDDAYRTVTETDLALDEAVEAPTADLAADDATAHADAAAGGVAEDAPEQETNWAHTSVEPDPADVELDAYVQAADRAVEIAADRASETAAHEADGHALTEHDLGLDDHLAAEAGSADEADTAELATAE